MEDFKDFVCKNCGSTEFYNEFAKDSEKPPNVIEMGLTCDICDAYYNQTYLEKNNIKSITVPASDEDGEDQLIVRRIIQQEETAS